VLTEEVVSGDGDDGESTKSYTYDANDRPLTITFKGETFWYVYNGHGDVMALTDKDGNVAARYEYDAWGLVTRMYNRYGERVREGIGWIGDLGTGNGSPGSVQGPNGGGNTTPDYHPGNGNTNSDGSTPNPSSAMVTPTESDSTPTSELTLSDIMTPETEPTDDITTELVKENPIRYAGYYWDRKTQFYYLQARYYDPRPARFISEDSYEGEIENPQSLNQYLYVENNPLIYLDPTGQMKLTQIDDLGTGLYDSLKGMITGIFSISTYRGLYQMGKALYKGEISLVDIGKSVVSSTFGPYVYVAKNTGPVFGGHPSNSQVREYGKNLGELLISFAASAKATSIITKYAPSLEKLLSKLKDKSASKFLGCNCFTAGTKVKTDGGEKNIEDIQVGDVVLSKNEVTGEVDYKEVTATFNHETDEIYKIHVGNQTIEATYNHPFWVYGKGWTFVKDLMPDDLLVQSDGNTLKIDSIDLEHKHVTVYNMTVDDFHTYFVSDLGIWVHNTSCSFGIGKYLTAQELNLALSAVKSGKDITFRTKQQAIDFIKSKFAGFKEEAAGNRSAEGWHFDSHPVDGSSKAINHINIYSKKQGFRVHIFWSE